jgi:hypothetical protein
VTPLHSRVLTEVAGNQMQGGEHAIALVALLYLPVAVTGLPLVEASVICLVLVGSSHRFPFGESALRNLASPRAHGGFLR